MTQVPVTRIGGCIGKWFGCVALAATLAIAPSTGLAQDDEDSDPTRRESFGTERRKSLAERIPSVTGRLYRKKGRMEVSPKVGLALNDPFFNHLIFGAELGYHITEWLGVGVSGEYYLDINNDIQVSGGGNPARPDFNRPEYGARLEVAFAPIYGKLSLLAEKVLYFDTYISGGVGVLGTSREGALLAGSITLGQRFFVNDWMAIRIELKDHLYRATRNPDAASGKDFQTLLSATVGVSFFLFNDDSPAPQVKDKEPED